MNAPVALPRSPRTSVMLRALVFGRGETAPSDHRVVNVSDTGLCVAQAEGLTADTIVAVTIGKVKHAPADVVWAEAGLAGLAFHAPIDLQAARTRVRGGGARPPAAGWMAELSSPYR